VAASSTDRSCGPNRRSADPPILERRACSAVTERAGCLQRVADIGTLSPVTEETLLDAIDKMEKAVEHVQSLFTSVRTGRASPALVEKLTVEYYGSYVPLQQLAGFQVPEARQLLVKPHDRATLGAIEKAIRDSDLGVNPSNDGVVIRLNFPSLTEQRRKEFVKVVKNMAEDGRVVVRNLRRDARKQLEAAEKASEISADQLERAEKELEKITHDHVELIDKAVGRKEQELLEV
jgi:ribosome recycling factor